MEKKTTWTWPKKNWDKLISEGKITFYEEDLKLMNATELVQILNIKGVRAHRGCSNEELRNLLRVTIITGKPPLVENPVDKIRKRLILFLDKYKHLIRDQIAYYCDYNCRNAPDVEVIGCYSASQKSIEHGLADEENWSDND